MMTMTPIIKVVGDYCNLKCLYCFYFTKDQGCKKVMRLELLEKFIQQYHSIFDGKIKYIWHGGEPLLAGINFFRKIVELQNRYKRGKQEITNTIQTNATLINDKWAKFFKKYNFGVGVSLDGDKHSNDAFRRNKKGSGCFDAIMRGVDVLRKYGIDPGFIQTVTKTNAWRAESNFLFMTEVLKADRFGINHFFDPYKSNEIMKSENVNNDDLIAFLKTYIDLWIKKDSANLKIREVENFLAGAVGKCASSCAFNGNCISYFLVENNGDIYPCDRLSTNINMLLGNIERQSLSEIIAGESRAKYMDLVSNQPDDCKACEWYNACHNGCPHHRVGGVNGKYYYCKTRKEVFSYIKEKMERSLH